MGRYLNGVLSPARASVKHVLLRISGGTANTGRQR